MNSYLRRAYAIQRIFIIGGIVLLLAGLWKNSNNTMLMAASLVLMGAFLSALIQLACYIKDEPTFKEDAINTSDDKRNDA